MKKKLIALLLCGFTTFSLFGCTSTENKKPETDTSSDAKKDDTKDAASDSASNTENKDEVKGPDYESGTTPELLEGITYEVPKKWDKKISEDGKNIYYYPDTTGTVPVIVMITYRAVDFSTTPAEEIPDLLSQVADGLSSGEGVKDLTKTEATFNDSPSLTAKYVQTVNSADYDVISNIIPVNQAGILTYTYGVKTGIENTYQEDFDYIYQHITLPEATKPAEPAASEPTPAPAAEETANTGATVEQKNALNKAASYLSFSAFSHDGLVEQLEYEGFSNESATYAADNCGADWNEQALKKAQSYLDMSAFSYSGLIEQLEYESFSTEQATYAVDNCGADWNEQAAKKAQSYMDMTSFSRESLIEQLEYEGFSADQAEYGVSAVGY